MRTKKKSTNKLAAEQRQRRQGPRAAHERESLVGVSDKNPKKSRSVTRTKATSNSRVSGQRIDKASIKNLIIVDTIQLAQKEKTKQDQKQETKQETKREKHETIEKRKTNEKQETRTETRNNIETRNKRIN